MAVIESIVQQGCRHYPPCADPKFCEHVQNPNHPVHHKRSSDSESVHHPVHYGGDVTYEAIKVIEAWELTFNTGNAAKYICRAGKKGDAIEDLEKSCEYLRFEIERLKRLKGKV